MRTKHPHLLAGLSALALLCPAVRAGSPPVVSNVTAGQRPDKQVEIRYSLSDLDSDECTVAVYASNDAGATWTVPITAVTGAIGPGISPGTGKLILWDSKVDLPGVVGSQFRVRVCAHDGDDHPPQIINQVITGAIDQGQAGTVQFSCTSTAPGGTVQSVVLDLTAIGGAAAQPLARGSGDQWQGSAQVVAPAAGLNTVTFTATTSGGASSSAPATIEVAPAGMVLIPAGQYQMGDPFTIEGDVNERPRHAVYVDRFFIDRYEVTNQQYADALNWARAQGGLITVTSGIVYKQGSGTAYPYCHTIDANSGSQITWNGSQFGVSGSKTNYPIVTVSWHGAAAYANWRSAMHGRPLNYDLSNWTCNWGTGYRLPTEAEWERAARGGVEGHRFPWSDVDTIDFGRANYYSAASPFYDLVTTQGYHPDFSGGGYPYTSPVGQFAPNGFGLFGMAGNAWEWCNDFYDALYYVTSPSQNPRGPLVGTNRVLRGGSWGSVALNLRCAYRSNGVPTFCGMLNGFRLVVSGAQ